MSYQIVFFDVDFTLVNAQKELPPDTIEAIKELKNNGIVTAIATGRPPYMFEAIAQTLGIDTFVSINGSLVIHKGEVIYRHTIEKDALSQLEERAAQYGHALSYFAREGAFANQPQHPIIVECFEDLRYPPPEFRPNAWKDFDIYQALVYCTEEEQHWYESMEELRFVRWHEFSMDALPCGSSKAAGIKVLLEHLGFAPSNAVAFGDGLNDLEMLNFVGMGVAMGNAHPQLRPHADFVTKSVDEGGIAFGLRHLQLIR